MPRISFYISFQGLKSRSIYTEFGVDAQAKVFILSHPDGEVTNFHVYQERSD